MTENSQNINTEIGSGGSNNSNGVEMEAKIQELLKSNNEIYEIRRHIINKKLEKLESENFGIIFRAMIPSLILLLLSFFVDISNVPVLGEVAKNVAQWVFPNIELINQGVTPIQFWWLPFLVYLIFLLTAYLCNNELKNEITQKGASENSISRIIDKYSGVVDGIGTALPLLGAAILLVSIKEGPMIFLGFAVPFEIKAIVVLAIAKLFDSVFSAQAVRYQDIQEELNKIERGYYANKETVGFEKITNELRDISKRTIAGSQGQGGVQISREELDQIYTVVKAAEELSDKFTQNLVRFKQAAGELSNIKLIDHEVMDDFKKVSETMNAVADTVRQSTDYSSVIKENMESVRKIVSELSSISLPDEKLLKELQLTANFIGETIKSLNESTAAKGLDNLAYLAGKRQ